MTITPTDGYAVIQSEATDPGPYRAYHNRFAGTPVPTKPSEWIERAAEVLRILAEDTCLCEEKTKDPFAQVALLKSSGLLKVLGPTKYGGGDAGWDVAYKVIREVAKGDGSLGMLLGYHLLWSWTSAVVGTDEQNDRTQRLIIENNYFIGGAVNPRDQDLTVADAGSHINFTGFRNVNTSGIISDLTVLEGVYEGTEQYVFALTPTKKSSTSRVHDSEHVSSHLTESRSVKIDVQVPWTDALGWDPKTKIPIASILTIPYATLLLPIIQVVFSNFYIGIALGSLSFASAYAAKDHTPRHPTARSVTSRSRDPYILQRYGCLLAHLRAAEALADQAGEKINDIYANHSAKRDISGEEREDVAELAASAEDVATDTAIRVTSGVFEGTGGKVAVGKAGLDRHWRL
ncbi:MAG: hypothetical protein Q9170_004067 [Blastenia crenularia]